MITCRTCLRFSAAGQRSHPHFRSFFVTVAMQISIFWIWRMPRVQRVLVLVAVTDGAQDEM